MASASRRPGPGPSAAYSFWTDEDERRGMAAVRFSLGFFAARVAGQLLAITGAQDLVLTNWRVLCTLSRDEFSGPLADAAWAAGAAAAVAAGALLALAPARMLHGRRRQALGWAVGICWLAHAYVFRGIGAPHAPFMTLLVLCVAASPAWLDDPARPRGHRPRRRAGQLTLPALVLLVALASGYGFSGYAKLASPEWRRGAVFTRREGMVMRSWLPAAALWLMDALSLPMSWFGLLTELTGPLAAAAAVLGAPSGAGGARVLLAWNACAAMMHVGVLAAAQVPDVSIGMLAVHAALVDVPTLRAAAAAARPGPGGRATGGLQGGAGAADGEGEHERRRAGKSGGGITILYNQRGALTARRVILLTALVGSWQSVACMLLPSVHRMWTGAVYARFGNQQPWHYEAGAALAAAGPPAGASPRSPLAAGALIASEVPRLLVDAPLAMAFRLFFPALTGFESGWTCARRTFVDDQSDYEMVAAMYRADPKSGYYVEGASGVRFHWLFFRLHMRELMSFFIGDHFSHLRFTGVWKQNDLRSCLVGLTFCSCSPVSGQRSIAANVRRVLEDAAAHGSVADAGGNATAWRAGEAPPPIVAIGGGGEEMPCRRCEGFKFCRSNG